MLFVPNLVSPKAILATQQLTRVKPARYVERFVNVLRPQSSDQAVVGGVCQINYFVDGVADSHDRH